MRREDLPARRLLACLALVPLLLGGCFGRSTLEGEYVEAAHGGRLQTLGEHPVADAEVRLMRLRLVQFDDEATGVVEIFPVRGYDVSEHDEVNWDAPITQRFCTRLDWATLSGGSFEFQFTDDLNRLWLVDAEFDKRTETLSGSMKRLSVDGRVVTDKEGPSYLLSEDENYYEHGGMPPQLVLQRTSAELGDGALDCENFIIDDALELDLSLLDFTKMGPPNARYRVALLLTRGSTDGFTEGLEGIRAQEVLTATLDGVDSLEGMALLDGNDPRDLVDVWTDSRRPIRMRMRPPTDFTQQDLAVGVFVLYEEVDDPDRKKLVWATSKEAIIYVGPEVPDDLRGQTKSANLYKELAFEDAPPGRDAPGEWWAHEYAYDPAILADTSRVMLIRHFSSYGSKIVTMVPATQTMSCWACYPTVHPRLSEGTICTGCTAIMPVLFR